MTSDDDEMTESSPVPDIVPHQLPRPHLLPLDDGQRGVVNGDHISASTVATANRIAMSPPDSSLPGLEVSETPHPHIECGRMYASSVSHCMLISIEWVDR